MRNEEREREGERFSMMAAKAEGIALLSLYGDDEEDEDAFAMQSEGSGAGEEANVILSDGKIINDRLMFPIRDNNPQMLTPSSPIRPLDGTDYEAPNSALPQPVPSWQQRTFVSQPSSPVSMGSHIPPVAPVPPFYMQESAVGRRMSSVTVTIVDYAHDEAAISPETEEERIEGGADILIGTELQGSYGHSDGATPVTSQAIMPNSQYECLQPLDVPELSKIKSSMAMDCTENEGEIGEVETSVALQKDDLLKRFLPPAVAIKCSEELQEKINKFLSYKMAGKSFNDDLRKKKDYRNPDFLQHAVGYQDIEQIGTCFGTEVFDPHGYDKSDFYDEIEADMNREMERKAQERKRSQKIDFVSGGIQPGEVAPALKMNNEIP
ncbi:uncharacterized protein LOC110020541, partial [Phalaenopsis equestris]|uniref:uncharacterized protein LOC110020541 n=1 Tax=Phalaenopsis equestris TaxID=78828 RepID=UPI0009E5CDC1